VSSRNGEHSKQRQQCGRLAIESAPEEREERLSTPFTADMLRGKDGAIALWTGCAGAGFFSGRGPDIHHLVASSGRRSII
jgi:hypothetical protein